MRSWNVRFWRRLGNPKDLYPCKALNYPCNIPHQLVIGGLMFPYDKYLNLNALISPILHGYRNKRTWGKEKRGTFFRHSTRASPHADRDARCVAPPSPLAFRPPPSTPASISSTPIARSVKKPGRTGLTFFPPAADSRRSQDPPLRGAARRAALRDERGDHDGLRHIRHRE